MFKSFIWIIFLSTFIVFLFMGKGALVNPYAWSANQNAMFYAFSQFIVIFDLFLLMFLMFTENAQYFKQFWEAKIFSVYSKLAVTLFLIYPTIMFFNIHCWSWTKLCKLSVYNLLCLSSSCSRIFAFICINLGYLAPIIPDYEQSQNVDYISYY